MINQVDVLRGHMEHIGGCGDGGCIVHVRPGMHTNGGCRCTRNPHTMFQVVHWHKRAVAEQAAQIEQLREALGRAHREALSLAQSIWRSEYRRKSPDWEPCDTVAGIITQIDNMYAGVRRQRDEARAALQAGEGE